MVFATYIQGILSEYGSNAFFIPCKLRSFTRFYISILLLGANLLVVKGAMEMSCDHPDHPVVHVIAGHLEDYSERLAKLEISSRDFH